MARTAAEQDLDTFMSMINQNCAAGSTGRARMTPTVLLVTPEADRQKAGRFTARLESSGEDIVANTRQPLVDGARELLARGFDPATPLTMRHEGKAYDSFQPLPIGQWAGWTYTEGETTPLRCVRWMPRPAVGEGQKSGSEPSVVPNPHPEANSLLRRDPTIPHASVAIG